MNKKRWEALKTVGLTKRVTWGKFTQLKERSDLPEAISSMGRMPSTYHLSKIVYIGLSFSASKVSGPLAIKIFYPRLSIVIAANKDI